MSELEIARFGIVMYGLGAVAGYFIRGIVEYARRRR